MAIEDCIKRAVEAKEISASDGERLAEVYDTFKRQQMRVNATGADLAAKQLAVKLFKAESGHLKAKQALTIKTLKEIDQYLGNDVGGNTIALLEHFGVGPDGVTGYAFSSAAGRNRAIIGQAHAKMEALILDFQRTFAFGRRQNKAKLENLTYELFGIDTKDQAAKALAKAWSETAEWLRRRYNAAGGAIAKLENWGLPQAHDARALRKAGKDTWKTFIRERLDISRMRHPLTEDAITAGELDHILDDIYDQIITDGWFKRQPTMQPYGKGALANRRMEHRFLIFQDGRAWLDYQREFGEGDPFTAMMNHVNLMARDIAHMEVLGPNPDAMLSFLKNTIAKEAQLKEAGKPSRFKGKSLSSAQSQINKIDAMWDYMRGSSENPSNQKVADGFAIGRNWISASVLGGAMLSAPGDLGTQMIARRFAGLPVAKTGLDVIEGFGIKSRSDAVRMGLILEDAQHSFHQAGRYVGSFEGPAWSRLLPDRVLTWTGLQPWTQANKHAFGKAAMSEFGIRAKDAYPDLPDGMQRLLARYGITAGMWDEMRKAQLYEPRAGAPFLRPREIADIDERLADRYLEMILMETEYAVPSSSVQARVALQGRADAPGSFWGEIQRSFATYKSFGTVYMVTHGRRTAMMIASSERGVKALGAKYAGALLISTTLFGALSIQLKNIAAGRDPQDIRDPAFWGAATLQGGGWGVYGDFLFSDINRYGGGLVGNIAGAPVEHVSDIWNLTAGNILQMIQGKETNFGRELVRFIKGNTPGGTMWFLRLGYERVLLDQLQFMLDPLANKSFKEQQQRRKREFTGQQFYWKPGQMTPERLPAFM